MTLKIKTLVLLLVGIALSTFATSASEADVALDPSDKERPVIGSYRVEIGRRSALSTYLSPFAYRGTDIALSGFWTKVLPGNPEHLAMHFEGRANIGDLLNPAHTAREIDLHAQLQWGMEWQLRFEQGWMISAGGSAGLYGGVLYLPRNGNNPVSAQFAAGIAINAYASKLFFIKSLPVLASDRLNLPLLSGFFCQEYGEPFYEIYLGNHRGLAHCGWPGNRLGIDNLLSLTLDLGRTALEIGYRFSMQNEQANHLTTRIFNHAFVIGVIPGGLGIKTNKKNIITPLY